MKINSDKIKNIIITVFGILFACWFLFRGCGDKINPPMSPIKEKEKTDLKLDKELKDSVRIKDSIRIHWVDKYKHDKAEFKKYPCDSIAPIIIADCDTVILRDTLEIIALKKVVKQDSLVIADYQQQGNEDSVTIGKLEKKVKHNRTIAKIAFITGIGIGGYAGFKLH